MTKEELIAASEKENQERMERNYKNIYQNYKSDVEYAEQNVEAMKKDQERTLKTYTNRVVKAKRALEYFTSLTVEEALKWNGTLPEDEEKRRKEEEVSDY